MQRSYPPIGEVDGQLLITRQSSNVVCGNITPESITTQRFHLDASDLALLKKMLKDFDGRLMKWKNPREIQDRTMGFPYDCLKK
jgi:hypothetical protein